jgi:hypothetical protein
VGVVGVSGTSDPREVYPTAPAVLEGMFRELWLTLDIRSGDVRSFCWIMYVLVNPTTRDVVLVVE